jgi:hypothetical protein
MSRPKEPCDLNADQLYYIERLYDDGGSDVEAKAYIYSQRGSFSNDLWDRWLEEELKFSETIKRGRLLSEAWWTREGRANLKDKDFSYTGWYMNMKNRFKWTDKSDINLGGQKDNPLTMTLPEADREALNHYFKTRGKTNDGLN